MTKFEDPIQFETHKESGGIKVTYSDLMEIAQGGPEIGKLSINGKSISNYRFGGPCLIIDQYVIAPVYQKKFFSSGFRLSKINCVTLEVEIIGKSLNLIFLDRFENGKVHYYESLDKTSLKTSKI